MKNEITKKIVTKMGAVTKEEYNDLKNKVTNNDELLRNVAAGTILCGAYIVGSVLGTIIGKAEVSIEKANPDNADE